MSPYEHDENYPERNEYEHHQDMRQIRAPQDVRHQDARQQDVRHQDVRQQDVRQQDPDAITIQGEHIEFCFLARLQIALRDESSVR